MNAIKKIYCRCFQTVFRIALPVLPYRNPELLNSLEDIPKILNTNSIKNPLIITDKNLSAIGATNRIQQILKKSHIDFAIYDKTLPNPTTELVEQALDVYRQNNCDSIIAYGGGSPMDLAKAVGAGLVRPGKPLIKMSGILKVRRRLPLLIAVPTTAGTGSETTLAAVIVDSDTRHKFTINDFPLIPRYAVLDPETISTLPQPVAVQTGLDALTHAVEAYIGRSTTRQTRAYAEKAVSLIFANLDAAARHESTESEQAMLNASHLAGRAFTRSYVGYIHAISHSLSGKYDLPHGWTNAALLPIILKRYGKSVWNKLARLAIIAGLGTDMEDEELLANKFISAIEQWNLRYGIPDRIAAIRDEDIDDMAKHADKEANPLYPVPVLWDVEQLKEIYREVKA